MNPQTFNFLIQPSVVPADVVTTVTIHPLGENVVFRQNETYTVRIRATETLCTDYREFPETVYTCTPNQQGELTVTHLFAGEQKHVILLERPESDLSSPYRDLTYRPKYGENVGATLAVYSLYPDLYGLKGYKGEVHCHTYASDGVQDIPHTVGNYRAAGYDFLAITDHYISFGSEQAKSMYQNSSLAMTLLLGEEVPVAEERIHAVHLGGIASVNAYFREHKQEVLQAVEAIAQQLDLPETVCKIDYAWRVWSANKSRELGGIAILAHPHWLWNEVYFMAEPLTEQLLKDGLYDALDLCDSDIDVSVALWHQMEKQGIAIPVVGSTDSHYTAAYNPHTPAKGAYTLVFAHDRSEQSLLNAIKVGNSLCVMTDLSPQFAVGPYRLVKYGRFLLDYFYPYYMWLCRSQASVVSNYSAQQEPLLSALTEQSERFIVDFYGEK